MINEIRGCVLNGRVTPEHDGFTSVTSHKGSAVVDYFLSRQADVNAMTKLKVVSAIEVIDQLELIGLVSDTSRIPDHSLLQLNVEMSTAVRERLCGNTLGSKSISRKRLIRKPGMSYMDNSTALRLLPSLLEELEGK